MHIVLKYSNKLLLKEKINILNLLKNSFKDELISTSVQNAFFNGYESDIKNFILLYDDELIVGIAIIAYRRINILSHLFKTITVGPIAIDPKYQGKGLSRLLMKQLDIIGDIENKDFIYLGGINNFYRQFNYYSCLSKSKIVINCTDIQIKENISVVPLKINHINRIKYLYNEISKTNSLTSKRDNKTWVFLINHCKNSYHFCNPHIVLYKKSIIGYFCTDPIERNRIRESVCLQKYNYVDKYLTGLKLYFDKIGEKKIELMSPINSLLYNYIKKDSTGIFIEYIKNNGGQLMKILKIDEFIMKINIIIYIHNIFLEYNSSKNIIEFTNLRKGSKKNMNKTFCDYKYFIGFISGKYKNDILYNYDEISFEFKEDLKNAFKYNFPFIYQGDNF